MHSIRAAEPGDATAIAHVHVQSWLTTYRGLVPESYLASLNESERVPLWQDWLTRDIIVFVAELGGGVVGFAGAGAIRESVTGYDAELYTLYLLQKTQRRGIGKALLSAVVEALISKGHRSMLVWVLEQNPALRFYEASGAKHIMRKQTEIGGVNLPELALGWPQLRTPEGFSWRNPPYVSAREPEGAPFKPFLA